jgi:hypothetical protein
MAEFLPKNLGEGRLPSPKGTLYTVPANKTVIVRSIILVNTHTTLSRTVNLYANFTGTSRHLIPIDSVIPPKGSLEFETPVTLEAGDLIEGDASAVTEVDYTISGVQTN